MRWSKSNEDDVASVYWKLALGQYQTQDFTSKWMNTHTKQDDEFAFQGLNVMIKHTFEDTTSS